MIRDSQQGFELSRPNSSSWAFSRQDEKIKLNGIINGSVTFQQYESYHNTLSTELLIAEAQRRYLKCSIRGFNNQLPNRFYKFVHLQLLNVRYKFVHLQLFDFKFLFSKTHAFRKQKRTAVYGRASLILDFKLTRENDDLLFPRHK